MASFPSSKPSSNPNLNSNINNNDTTETGPTDNRKLDDAVCLDDLEQLALEKLERPVFEFIYQGSGDETTLRWNRSMIIERYCLRPRVLRDVSQMDLSKYIYGDKLDSPIGISPTAMHKLMHPDGELATVRACHKSNTLMTLSLFASTSLEAVAREAPTCTKWQNIYILKDRELTMRIVHRAVMFGYRAIVVTCDSPVVPNRRRDARNKYKPVGAHLRLENIEPPLAEGDVGSEQMSVQQHSETTFDASVTWRDMANLKKRFGDSLRVIAKGIMSAEDAELALDAGVDGIFVSNHGGRQLNSAQSTIEALPEVVAAVRGRCPVFVDGGFRTGADVLKALALGADMVFIGRPLLWGLAAGGEAGAYKAICMLKDELRKAMMLCGCNSLAQIERSIAIPRNR